MQRFIASGHFTRNDWKSVRKSETERIFCATWFQFVIRRRRARAVQGTCQPARMDAYSMDNVSPSNTWQRGKMRSSLRASKRSYLNQAFDDPVREMAAPPPPRV